jgi:predicted RNA-binding protein
MCDLTIFRLIGDVLSIESTGDKTGKIDVFAVKKNA